MMQKLISLALLILLGAFSDSPIFKDVSPFELWKQQHQKHYHSKQQLNYRKSVFESNSQTIKLHNLDKTQTYQLGLTQFADLTQQEFALLYLGTKTRQYHNLDISLTNDNIRGLNIDWEKIGKVSQVKNQGMCGSCWAFSAVGGLESQSRIMNRTDLFSQQQLVDCSKSYGNEGCGGGWMQYAFQYVRDKGIVQQSEYAYVGKNQSCLKDGGKFKISNYSEISGCDNMVNALSNGPISVAVDATFWSWYKSGVFSNCSSQINHGVLLVGVSDSYWRVKNSWGSQWGQEGYIRLSRGNTCDICHYPIFPKELLIK